ncbi:hypothetical protein KVR01_001320 [Diaporthe batatas]|uniref:uncharacterized protein n=1 Tax=Diaporthe batatas TaxID=748121 RepID=UPI001D03A8D6|nr:uncharacterized protein KVR01_001320 [Diaporthe batatas]KAG8168571.1 hypothetical protein KVR01_001320 [Diaporthe batatas]
MSAARLGCISSRIHACIRVVRSLFILEPASVATEKFEHGHDGDHFIDSSAWSRVDSELTGPKSAHHRFWWNKNTGHVLAVLLDKAGYSPDLQYRHLKFFAGVIAPHLGASLEPSVEDRSQWHSFMTDDGTPVELSWDWGTSGGPPMIRYSVEPVGLHAGSALDPSNNAEASVLDNQLIHALPDMRLEWFNHFNQFFNGLGNDQAKILSADDHETRIFYAFDLSADCITAKTYFFPKFRAKADGISNLDVLSKAIDAAPLVTKLNSKAWSLYHQFSTESSDKLEQEMLAIDHIDPLQSRIKIYFRSRKTDFDSVASTMTLNGRNNNPKLREGLQDLKRLWKILFEVDTPGQSLPEVGHRTAGILYNVEFKLGDSFPVAKVYLPVRHYAKSDEGIIQALGKYLDHHGRGKYLPQYVDAMHTLL